jgi:hypothetical protein
VPEPKGQGSVSGTAREVLGTSAVLDSAHLGDIEGAFGRIRLDRTRWRMPQLALLEPVMWSAGTKLGMLALRGYRVIGAVLLVVKAVQLGSR